MNLTWKRNYKIVIGFVVFILLGVVFGSTRNMSYNFGEYATELAGDGQSYSGGVDIMDDSLVHEVYIDVSQEQYEYMLQSYQQNREKEYVSVTVSIDGVEIQNVGLRLKGNLDLVSLLSDSAQVELSHYVPSSYLLKFDKFVSGQNYMGYSELALRVDSENSNLGQMLSQSLAQDLGLYAPDTVFSTLEFGPYGSYFYILSEEINESYIAENFTDTSGVLFEAENELSFHYLGEDPVKYLELFDQETQVNKEDYSVLIDLLSFVTQSSDEEFAEKLSEYIDIDNYVSFLALNEVLGEDDMLLGLLNNYYIYFDSADVAHFILWDQKISFGSITTSLEEIIIKYYDVEDISDLNIEDLDSLISFSATGIEGESISENSGKYLNDLRDRFLENDTFSELYEAKVDELESQIYGGLAQEKLDYFYDVFLASGVDASILSDSEFLIDYASYWNVFSHTIQ